jgi:glycosyltransferase involved in cell wall biosynthesis
MLLSVVLPAFNEGNTIEGTLAQLLAYLRSSFSDFEIIVIDDGSNDDTAIAVRRAAEDTPLIRLISYMPNHGKGYAIRRGVDASSGQFVAFFDADLDISPKSIFDLYTLLATGQYSGAIGFKVRDGSYAPISLKRAVVTRITHVLVWVLFQLPFRDTQVGVKIFRRALLDAVRPELTVDGFSADIELLYWAHRKGFLIAEGPVTVVDSTGESSVNLRSIARAAFDVFVLFFRVRIKTHTNSSNGI